MEAIKNSNVRLLKTNNLKQFIITADITSADLELVQTLSPKTLVLVDEDKRAYFAVGVGSTASVSVKGISVPRSAEKVNFTVPVEIQSEVLLNATGVQIRDNFEKVITAAKAFLETVKENKLDEVK